MINPMDLTGKRILVTGATSGIGKATAIQLSRLGANVVILGRKQELLENTLAEMDSGDHASYSFDLSDVDGIEGLMKNICEERGVFHGFVHCAGVAPLRPFSMTKFENILDVMKPNYFAFVEIVRCITKKNRFADEGSIVAISSIGAIQGKQTKTAYSASKAAIDASIRCMVCDLKKKRIRINSVMPSWVNTRMYQAYMEKFSDTFEVKEIQEKQYMGVSEPEEVANTVAFLLSDAAKTITGTSILIDGGISQG